MLFNTSPKPMNINPTIVIRIRVPDRSDAGSVEIPA
jgi:hypothetical protein